MKSKIAQKGFVTTLFIGNNFALGPILIKSMTPTFSSELCYAPIKAINKLVGREVFNPYTSGELLVKGISQSICSLLALGNNRVQGAVSFIKKLPKPISKILLKDDGSVKVKDLPSYPIRAEVNMSVELQFPITRATNSLSSKQSKTNIARIFREEGFFDFGY